MGARRRERSEKGTPAGGGASVGEGVYRLGDHGERQQGKGALAVEGVPTAEGGAGAERWAEERERGRSGGGQRQAKACSIWGSQSKPTAPTGCIPYPYARVFLFSYKEVGNVEKYLIYPRLNRSSSVQVQQILISWMINSLQKTFNSLTDTDFLDDPVIKYATLGTGGIPSVYLDSKITAFGTSRRQDAPDGITMAATSRIDTREFAMRGNNYFLSLVQIAAVFSFWFI
eukprot:Gb_11452 [translate_table: standard]